jgi:hypothetical protein
MDAVRVDIDQEVNKCARSMMEECIELVASLDERHVQFDELKFSFARNPSAPHCFDVTLRARLAAFGVQLVTCFDVPLTPVKPNGADRVRAVHRLAGRAPHDYRAPRGGQHEFEQVYEHGSRHRRDADHQATAAEARARRGHEPATGGRTSALLQPFTMGEQLRDAEDRYQSLLSLELRALRAQEPFTMGEQLRDAEDRYLRLLSLELRALRAQEDLEQASAASERVWADPRGTDGAMRRSDLDH